MLLYSKSNSDNVFSSPGDLTTEDEVFGTSLKGSKTVNYGFIKKLIKTSFINILTFIRFDFGLVECK